MTYPETYTGTITIDAPQESVSEVLTTVSGIRGWWTPIVTGSVAPGATFHLGFEDLDETIELTVVDADGGRVEWLVRYHSAAPDWAGSRIVFRHEGGPAGCVLEVEHSGVDPHRVAPGWNHFLDSIRALVETGKGHPYPRSADDALAVALRYHQAWTGRRFDEAVALLSDRLETDVPINTYSSREEWAAALVGFGRIVDRADLVSTLGGADEAVLVYDMHTVPYGTLRIAEHFTVRDGSIVRILHVHDTAPLRAATLS